MTSVRRRRHGKRPEKKEKNKTNVTRTQRRYENKPRDDYFWRRTARPKYNRYLCYKPVYRLISKPGSRTTTAKCKYLFFGPSNIAMSNKYIHRNVVNPAAWVRSGRIFNSRSNRAKNQKPPATNCEEVHLPTLLKRQKQIFI